MFRAKVVDRPSSMSHSDHHYDDYRVFDVLNTPFGDEKMIVQLMQSGKRYVLMRLEAELLLSCQHFAPLHEHARRFVGSSSADISKTYKKHISRVGRSFALSKQKVHSNEIVAALSVMLRSFIDRGLLISRRSLQQNLSLLQQPECNRSKRATISSLGIVSSGDLECLQLAITTFLDDFRSNGRSLPEITISYGPTQAEIPDRPIRELLRAKSRQYGTQIFLADIKSRTQYATAL